MNKPLPGTELLKQVKNKVKQERSGKMKKLDWKAIKIVVITLSVIAWFFIGSIAGWNAKGWFNDNVQSEVRSLSAVVSKE